MPAGCQVDPPQRVEPDVRESSSPEDTAALSWESLDRLLPCMDVEERRHWLSGLLSTLGVEEEPIGAEALQEMSRHAGLEPNELSRDLIAAREE